MSCSRGGVGGMKGEGGGAETKVTFNPPSLLANSRDRGPPWLCGPDKRASSLKQH